MTTVYELQANTLKESLKNGKRNEQEALAYINELEAKVKELESELNG